MAKSKRTSFIRGKRMRATRLTSTGLPVYGENAVVTTKGFVTVSYTTNVEEGEAISQTNADGDTCVSEPATPTFTGFTVEAEFCEVDFALFEILTGQPVVLDEHGQIIGITESTDVDLSAFAFALEMWLGADTKGAAPSAGSQGEYGYVLTPFLSGGVINDVSVENGAINFTVGSMATKNGARWGAGPYDVELVGGEPSPLRTPLRSRDHRRTQIVEVAPPTVHSGATPLLNPDDSPLTGITVVGSGNEATVSATDGDGALFVEWGDGEWSSSDGGDVTHEYEVDGSYTITAHRGSGTVTEDVVVPFP